MCGIGRNPLKPGDRLSGGGSCSASWSRSAPTFIDAILGTWGVVNGLAALALLLPNFSVAIRRLHDTDHSGWWLLIALIPIIGFIVLLVFYVRESDPGENKYGPPPVAGIAAPDPV